MIQSVTQRPGPEVVTVRWTANGGSALGDIGHIGGGGSTWMFMPVYTLQSDTWYAHPDFLAHELLHNFGYEHGDEMKDRSSEAKQVFGLFRWFIDKQPNYMPQIRGYTDRRPLTSSIVSQGTDPKPAATQSATMTVKHTTAKIVATKGWQTVNRVAKSESLKLTATGTWCGNSGNPKEYTFYPDGTRADKYSPQKGGCSKEFNRGALIGRVRYDDGTEYVFVVGKELEITFDRPGILEMRINYDDNQLPVTQGELTVKIINH